MCIRKTYIIKKSKQRMHVKGCSKLAKIKQNSIQSLNQDVPVPAKTINSMMAPLLTQSMLSS